MTHCPINCHFINFKLQEGPTLESAVKANAAVTWEFMNGMMNRLLSVERGEHLQL